jgi:hypothetical protein
LNAWNWEEGTYFTTFIVGARYITVLHINARFEQIVEEVLELVGKDKTPFVIVSSICCNPEVILDNELAELVIGA